jgi:hypothetical protein
MTEKTIAIPEGLLAAYLSEDQRKTLSQSGVRVLSITVQGTKGMKEREEACCTPLASAGSGPCCHPHS